MADTDEEAAALMLPNLQLMARLRTGQPLTALDLVEDAEEQSRCLPRCSRWSTPAWPEPSSARRRRAAEQVRELAEQFGVDEVMVNPVASARRGTDPRTRTRPRSARSSCSPGELL